MAFVKKAKGKYICCWREPGSGRQRSKTCGAGRDGKRLAEKLKRKVEAEIVLGEYGDRGEIRWLDFMQEYRDKVIDTQSPRYAEQTWGTLSNLNRLIKFQWIHEISTRYLQEYVRLRKYEGMANSTVNKELTIIRTMLSTARRWGYIAEVPYIPFMRNKQKTVRSFVNEEEFRAIYGACDAASQPTWPNITPGDWWRGFLLFQFMTGWRVGMVLNLKWADLCDGVIVSLTEDNKGKRDVALKIHPEIMSRIEVLRATGEDTVFPNRLDLSTLQYHFDRIQKAANIKPRNRGDKWYSFHDLRRGFATLNAPNMDPFELQRLMLHKSISTTQRYVEMAHRLSASVDKVVVPSLDDNISQDS